MFHRLRKESLLAIVEKMLGETRARLAERKLTLELTETAREWLVTNGFDAEYGARPLRRLIQRQVENPLAKQVLAGEYQDGDGVLVDVSADDALTFTRRAGEPTGAARDRSGARRRITKFPTPGPSPCAGRGAQQKARPDLRGGPVAVRLQSNGGSVRRPVGHVHARLGGQQVVHLLADPRQPLGEVDSQRTVSAGDVFELRTSAQPSPKSARAPSMSITGYFADNWSRSVATTWNFLSSGQCSWIRCVA